WRIGLDTNTPKGHPEGHEGEHVLERQPLSPGIRIGAVYNNRRLGRPAAAVKPDDKDPGPARADHAEVQRQRQRSLAQAFGEKPPAVGRYRLVDAGLERLPSSPVDEPHLDFDEFRVPHRSNAALHLDPRRSAGSTSLCRINV